jgi:hypothetical protein
VSNKQPANAQLACRVTNEDYLAIEQMATVMQQSKSELLRYLIHLAAEDWREIIRSRHNEPKA